MSAQARLRAATAFLGERMIASGPLAAVALAVRAAGGAGTEMPLVFDDATGRIVDLDLRGSEAEVAARFDADFPAPSTAPAGRGRPKLGVVAREVTLLPRQWEWLGRQPGGASAALRRLVDRAQRGEAPAEVARAAQRAAQEATYHALHVLAGDRPGYEEATRALFAGDLARMTAEMAGWPADIRDYALRLASGGQGGEPAGDAA